MTQKNYCISAKRTFLATLLRSVASTDGAGCIFIEQW